MQRNVTTAVNVFLGVAAVLALAAAILVLPQPWQRWFVAITALIILGLILFILVPSLRRVWRPPQIGVPTVESALSAVAIVPADLDDIAFVASQEKTVYSSQDAVPEHKLREWFLRNRNGFNLIKLDDQKVGHVNFLPLKARFLAEFIDGKIVEKDATANDIHPPTSRQHIKDIYVESVAILHPSESVRGKILLQLFSDFLAIITRVCAAEQLQHIYAMAATKDGQRLLSHLSFEIVNPSQRRKDEHLLFRASPGDLARMFREKGRSARKHLRLKAAAKNALKRGL